MHSYADLRITGQLPNLRKLVGPLTTVDPRIDAMQSHLASRFVQFLDRVQDIGRSVCCCPDGWRGTVCLHPRCFLEWNHKVRRSHSVLYFEVCVVELAPKVLGQTQIHERKLQRRQPV